MLRSERRREPPISIMPSSPGNSAAKNIRTPRSEGRTAAAVGAVVVMWKLTGPDALIAGGTVQVDAVIVDGSLQVKLTVPLNGLTKVTVTVASTLDP